MVKYLTLLLCMIYTVSYSQSLHYDKNGKVDGILLTIEEASKIDNDYELLEIYKSLSTEYEELEKIYVSIMDGFRLELEAYEVKVNLLEEQLKDTNTLNAKLDEQNKLYLENSILYKTELDNNKIIMDQQLKKLKQEKRNKWVLFGATIITGSILYFTK